VRTANGGVALLPFLPIPPILPILPIPSNRRVEQYDERAAGKLLSPGNRFVRNVKRARWLEVLRVQ
jgi:hypothetical protein